MEKKIVKEKLREEENKKYSEKVNELKFNDKIDDSYTSSVIGRYEKGHKKNKWFIASGSLSIIFGIACILAVMISLIIFSRQSDSLKSLAAFGEYDFEAKKEQVTVCGIVFSILGILGILIGIRIMLLSNYSRDTLIKKTPIISFYIVLQTLFGGVIFSIFSVAGYFVGRGIDYGAIYYNRIDDYKDKQFEEDIKYSEDSVKFR